MMLWLFCLVALIAFEASFGWWLTFAVLSLIHFV